MNRFLTALKSTLRDRLLVKMSLVFAGVGIALLALPIYGYLNDLNPFDIAAGWLGPLAFLGMAVGTIIIPTITDYSRRRG